MTNPAPTKSSLNIMLDTNVLYVDGRSDHFFSPNIAKVIEDPSHAQLNIGWSIPSMVRREREYQLRQHAKHIVSAAREMPSLFASTWVGNPDAVNAEISRLAQQELDRLKVRVYECDSHKVDWPGLMDSAGWRLPPFDPNEKNEKGFKDAIVAETFVQLCGELTSHGVDTAILVTNDTLLREYVESRIKSPRVKILRNVDALMSELNFLVSDIDPDTAIQLQPMANELLATANEFWSNVGRLATPYCHPPFVLAPFGVSDIELQVPSYSPPVFLRKEMRRVFFFTRYAVPRTGQQWLPAFAPPQRGLLAMGDPVGGMVPPTGGVGYYNPLSTPDASPLGNIQVIMLPSVSFAVEWSADYDVSKSSDSGGAKPIIRNPRIESVTPEPI
ncbi:PIN domain-containing protein [Paraburkholderia nemoris]|uniref:PIN domain-containing protein n=1 Tax=Paraburkholderia nemoris TaxID=2793076 RepID=UPI0038BC60E2